VSEWSGLTWFISSLELCTTVVVRSAVTGPDSSQALYPLGHRGGSVQL